MRSSLLTLACLLPLAAQTLHKLPVSAKTVVVGSYDGATPPALRIRSGDSVDVETLAAVSVRSWENVKAPPNRFLTALRDVVAASPNARGHNLTGPIFIEGAETGDTLEVQILQVALAVDHAYNGIGPTGALAAQFPNGGSKLIMLDSIRKVAIFSPEISIPLSPFFGSMGVAPPSSIGKVSSVPPGNYAGNLDNRELIAGTKLFIPVHVPGALFQVGDGHAAQGDGEIDVTALETHLTGRLRFVVHKNKTLLWPRAETPTHWIAMGLDEDLNKAMTAAAAEAVKWLVELHGMTPADAYMLCSTAVNFRVTQVVDRTKGVHAMIPKSLWAATGK